MIRQFSHWLAQRVIASGQPGEFDSEWVIYWLEKKIGQAVSAVSLLATGLLLQNILGAAVYFIFLLRLKGSAGGLHAKTQFRCLAITTAGFLFPQLLLKFVLPNMVLFHVFAFVCTLVIFIMAPAENPKEHLTRREISRYKIITRVTLSVEVVICIVLSVFNIPLTVLLSGYSAIYVVAITLVIPNKVPEEK